MVIVHGSSVYILTPSHTSETTVCLFFAQTQLLVSASKPRFQEISKLRAESDRLLLADDDRLEVLCLVDLHQWVVFQVFLGRCG